MPAVSCGCAYLATGCDAFLSREPGLADAMALVHSRVARVFFLGGARAGGALAGAQRLQTLRGLNHRFCVYRVDDDGAGGGAG